MYGGPFKRAEDGEEALTLIDTYNVTLTGGPGGSRVCQLAHTVQLTFAELLAIKQNGKVHFIEADYWHDCGASIFWKLPTSCFSANSKYVSFTGCTSTPTPPPSTCVTPTGYTHQNDWLYTIAALRGTFEMWTNGAIANWDTYWADLGISTGDTAKYYE